MKLVQKGNRQLRIQDDQLENLLAAGYTEVDEKTGKILKKEPKDDVKALKADNTALKKANADLTAANKELTAQVETLTKQLEEKAAGDQ